MKLNSTSCQNLEQIISPSSSRLQQSKLKQLRNQISNLIVKLLKPQRDPVIHEFIDRNGNKKWRVYAPITDKKVILNSPKEVLIWLDDRYSNHTNEQSDDSAPITMP
jgi:hypothetical protein